MQNSMIFDDVLENEIAKKYLLKILDTQQVPHLLLFSGIQESGSSRAAMVFAKEWLRRITAKPLKHYVDVHTLRAEGKLGLHSMQSVHEMLEKAALAPLEAEGKVFIIEHAERMLPSSANALLKMIEEPHKQTLIILVTAQPGQLLSTIRSRCQKVSFHAVGSVQRHSEYKDFLLFLQKGKFSFIELSQQCEQIQKQFDLRRKGLEKQQGSGYSQEMLKEMNAVQRQKIEQEFEGAAATQWMHEAELLLEDIIRLHRQKLSLPALEKMYQALSFAKLALERSTPIKNVLESFLISMI